MKGLYFGTFIIIFLLACRSLKGRPGRKFNKYVASLYVLLTAMLCFRYGQGTDYFSYGAIFNQASSLESVFNTWHGEPLYLFLCFIFNRFANYQVFIMVVSFAQMFMMWDFINRRSSNRTISIMIFLSVIYVIYFFNLIRQGFTISVFLRYGTELIEQRRWRKYFALCAVLSLIHSVSAIYFCVPLAMKFSVKSLLLSIFLCAAASVTVLRPFLAQMIPYSASHVLRPSAAIERALSFIMIYEVYISIYGNKGRHWWMKLYSFGTALYFLFVPFSLVASRVAICFKVLEVMIVPNLMNMKSRYRHILVYYFLVLSLVMFIHDLTSEIENGGYVRGINFLNFPYVSVFNAGDIYNYKK